MLLVTSRSNLTESRVKRSLVLQEPLRELNAGEVTFLHVAWLVVVDCLCHRRDLSRDRRENRSTASDGLGMGGCGGQDAFALIVVVVMVLVVRF